MESLSLAALVAARIAAKRDEDAAVARRRELDAAIAAQLADPAKLEGSRSERAGDYKVTVTFGVTRKVDADSLKAAWANLPPSVTAAFKWNPEVSVTELRKLGSLDTALAARFITTSPASPSIKVEAV